jgi:hypothetical protein
MNDDALRAIVRDTIARLSTRAADQAVSDAPKLLHLGAHPSGYQYTLPPSDGPCFIEPGVPCNHCGYCQTHGH